MFKNVKLFRLQEFIQREARWKSSFRKSSVDPQAAACRLHRSSKTIHCYFSSRIILSQFNQPVIKELGLTLQLYSCISTIRAVFLSFFLLGLSKLNFLYLQCPSFDGRKMRERERTA